MEDKIKSKRGGARPGAGSPRVEIIPSSKVRKQQIQLDALEALCECGATHNDIAAYFRISRRTLTYIRKREPAVKEVMDNAHDRGKVSLRRRLYEKAMKGDTACLIFLNKNENGMSDRVASEISGPGGKPIETKDVSEHTAILDEFLGSIEISKTQILHVSAGEQSKASLPEPSAS